MKSERFFSLASVDVMLCDLFKASMDFEFFRIQVHASGFDLCHIQHIVDEVQEVLSILLDEAQVIVHVIGEVTVQSFEYYVGKAKDRVEWRA